MIEVRGRNRYSANEDLTAADGVPLMHGSAYCFFQVNSLAVSGQMREKCCLAFGRHESQHGLAGGALSNFERIPDAPTDREDVAAFAFQNANAAVFLQSEECRSFSGCVAQLFQNRASHGDHF